MVVGLRAAGIPTGWEIAFELIDVSGAVGDCLNRVPGTYPEFSRELRSRADSLEVSLRFIALLRRHCSSLVILPIRLLCRSEACAAKPRYSRRQAAQYAASKSIRDETKRALTG